MESGIKYEFLGQKQRILYDSKRPNAFHILPSEFHCVSPMDRCLPTSPPPQIAILFKSPCNCYSSPVLKNLRHGSPPWAFCAPTCLVAWVQDIRP